MFLQVRLALRELPEQRLSFRLDERLEEPHVLRGRTPHAGHIRRREIDCACTTSHRRCIWTGHDTCGRLGTSHAAHRVTLGRRRGRRALRSGDSGWTRGVGGGAFDTIERTGICIRDAQCKPCCSCGAPSTTHFPHGRSTGIVLLGDLAVCRIIRSSRTSHTCCPSHIAHRTSCSSILCGCTHTPRGAQCSTQKHLLLRNLDVIPSAQYLFLKLLAYLKHLSVVRDVEDVLFLDLRGDHVSLQHLRNTLLLFRSIGFICNACTFNQCVMH
mmetsp:Transcript_17079/g.28685  ORF Transcript_17079/g.28685 Transcript_17079/m.28685 type:complete len:270 (-) Transcript_17079:991-1800(-)